MFNRMFFAALILNVAWVGFLVWAGIMLVMWITSKQEIKMDWMLLVNKFFVWAGLALVAIYLGFFFFDGFDVQHYFAAGTWIGLVYLHRLNWRDRLHAKGRFAPVRLGQSEWYVFDRHNRIIVTYRFYYWRDASRYATIYEKYPNLVDDAINTELSKQYTFSKNQIYFPRKSRGFWEA